MVEVRFRASACGRYVCSVVADRIRVLTAPEAARLHALYLDYAERLADEPELAAHERTMAAALHRAMSEASWTRSELAKRAVRQRREAENG